MRYEFLLNSVFVTVSNIHSSVYKNPEKVLWPYSSGSRYILPEISLMQNTSSPASSRKIPVEASAWSGPPVYAATIPVPLTRMPTVPEKSAVRVVTENQYKPRTGAVKPCVLELVTMEKSQSQVYRIRQSHTTSNNRIC